MIEKVWESEREREKVENVNLGQSWNNDLIGITLNGWKGERESFARLLNDQEIDWREKERKGESENFIPRSIPLIEETRIFGPSATAGHGMDIVRLLALWQNSLPYPSLSLFVCLCPKAKEKTY